MRLAFFIVAYCLLTAPLQVALVTGVMINASGAQLANAVVTATGALATTGGTESLVLPDKPGDSLQAHAAAARFVPASLTVSGDIDCTRLVFPTKDGERQCSCIHAVMRGVSTLEVGG